MSFPAVMRTYIEYISANGLCYHYEAGGCHGDCRADPGRRPPLADTAVNE